MREQRNKLAACSNNHVVHRINNHRQRNLVCTKGLRTIAILLALTSAPAVAQEYGPYPLDGPPYGSTYYPFDYNLPGGRVRPGIPPGAPYPFPGEMAPPDTPYWSPEYRARRQVCPPGWCGSDDDK